MSVDREPWSERIYRILLRAHPRPFRRRFEEDLLEVFRAERREPRYRGLRGGARFWWHIGRDWARTLWETRRVVAGRGPDGGLDDARGKGGILDAVRQDLAFAVRSLSRSPGFTLIAVITLALGIGSSSAMFGVLRSVLFEPLAYGEPDRLVTIWSSWRDTPKAWVSEAEYRVYLTQSRSFEDLAIWNEVDVTFTDPTNPERVAAVGATPNLADVLGAGMAVGRFFTEGEAMRADTAAADVMVISHEAWTRRWNGDPSVVGSSEEMNGRMREIVGVLPSGFRLPTQYGTGDVADVYVPRWVPRTTMTDYPDRGGPHFSYVVGRLRPGVPAEGVGAELEQIVARIHAELGSYPDDFDFRPLVLRVEDDVLAGARRPLWALFGTVGLVLLIACANVANLTLARGETRFDELSVRAALGAGRRRLVGQLSAEAAVLALAGGAVGVGVALVLLDIVRLLGSQVLPRVEGASLDALVLAFTFSVAMATTFLVGVWPALRTTRGHHSSAGVRWSTGGRGQGRWQAALVSVQTAMALVLTVGAGLMARTFQELQTVDPGFHGSDALSAAISLPRTRYPDHEAAAAFWRRALMEVEEIPAVRAASAIRSMPLSGQLGDWGLDIEGYDESANPPVSAGWQIAAPGHFGILGVPITRGRDFAWSDDADGPLAIVINEALADRYWPRGDPLGKRIRVSDGPWGSVVGVVGNVRYEGLTTDPDPTFYVAMDQWNLATGGVPTALRVVVAGAGPPRDLVEPVRTVVRRLDSRLAIAEVRTVSGILRDATAEPRLLLVLMSGFCGIAMILALVGVYGVVSYAVGTRTREIGVRMALGAVEDQVVGLMLRRAAAMVGLGLLVGTALALLGARYLETLLYGVAPTDPLTFLVAVSSLALVALLASWVPSRRGARVDPIRALRAE